MLTCCATEEKSKCSAVLSQHDCSRCVLIGDSPAAAESAIQQWIKYTLDTNKTRHLQKLGRSIAEVIGWDRPHIACIRAGCVKLI